MKTSFLQLAVIGLILFGIRFQSNAKDKPPRKYRKLEKYIHLATENGLPGLVIYVQSPKYGEWVGVSGLADINSNSKMSKDHIFSMGSVGKMYNAVAVHKLVEEGKLKLDDKISEYLPDEIIQNMENARAVTIRHLLGHTSGWEDYDKDPELNKLYLSGQLKLDTLSRLNVLRRYMYGKKGISIPGTEFHYSSTNFLLLAMIIDKVVPEGHTAYLRNLILSHGFRNTFYREKPPQQNVSYYGDLNQDGELENLTAQTFETTNWFTGDDGVYAPIEEAAHFLQSLMKGKVLSAKSLSEMKTGNKNIKIDTGLGLIAGKDFPYGHVYGHGGRGIGTTADVYYFPKKDITIVIFCNTGLRGAHPKFRKTYNKLRMRIVKKLFLF